MVSRFSAARSLFLAGALFLPLCAGAGEPLENPWFWGVGSCNYHVPLRESEALIDRQLNTFFPLIFPNWERPVTFADWSEDFMIWDLWGLVGRKLSPRWSCYAAVGGSGAPIHNHESPKLFGVVPFKADMGFTRADVYGSLGLTYYPWGMPQYPESGSFLSRAVNGVKPFVELMGNYTYLHGTATVKMGPVFAPNLFKQKQVFDYHLVDFAPTLGAEFPVSPRSAVLFKVNYHLFTTHQDEFNSPGFSLSFKHSFGGGRRAEKKRGADGRRDD